MKALSKKWLLSMLMIGLVIALVACNTGNNNNNEQEPVNNTQENSGETNEEENKPEDVTLIFDYPDEENFIEDFKEPIEAKFPHITLEYFENVLEDVEEDIAKGSVPDVYYLSGGDKVEYLEEYQLAYDLSELIEKESFDLNTIIDANVDIARKWSNGSLYYLPYEKRWQALYYNKDIFDNLGEDYPEDGMTWDEVVNLARKLTGEVGGERYRGIEINDAGGMLEQLEVNHVDPETDQSLYASDDRFNKYLERIDTIASIPGVLAEGDEESGVGGFISDRNVAMMPLFDAHLWFAGVEEDTGLAWDMVSYPVWEEHPDRGPLVNAAGFAITDTSEHKEAAFEVISYLVSEEWQMMRAKKGYSPILASSAVQEAFASEVDILKDKNMLAPYYLDESTGPEELSKYEQVGKIISIEEFVEQNQDINTYLRELAEEADNLIQEAIGTN